MAYIYEHFSDLSTTTNSLIVLSAGFASIGSYISIGANMKSAKLLHNELQKIVNKGNEKLQFKNLSNIET